MRSRLQKHLHRYLIRPIAYKTLSYFLTALIFSIVWNRWLNRQRLHSMSYIFSILGVIFLALAWIDYLRLDGVRIPRLGSWRLQRKLDKKEQTAGSFKDISDYIDEEVVTFAELSTEERDLCCLLANLICGLSYLGLSLL